MRKARCSAVLKKAQATAGWGFGAVVLSNSAQLLGLLVLLTTVDLFSLFAASESTHTSA
jgi:hypothetical protein